MPASNANTLDAGFQTLVPGTRDAVWRAWMRSIPEWLPDTAPLVVVAPHPDDETLGAGGLINLCARRGLSVRLICVTDGEAARPEMPDLAAIRIAEFDAASRHLLGYAASVDRLGMPDGAVARYERELAWHLGSRIPDNATLIAPYERDGHTDHDAIGRVCRDLATKRNLTLARYPIWAWHRLEPGAFGHESAVRVRLDDKSLAAKSAAIDCYRSQTEERAGGAIVPAHVLAYFRRNHEVYFL